MLFIILLTIIIIFYIKWLYTSYHNTWKYIARFPGPRTFPIFGNVLQLGTNTEAYCRTIRCWLSEYKFESFRIYAGPQPYIFISNHKHFETVLSSTTLLEKGDVYDLIEPWLGQGLLIASGINWVKHRKMITPSFHFQILQDFLQIINETTDRFTILLEGFAQTGKIFDFQDIVSRSTLDIICECAMGYRLNSIEGGKSPMIKAINDLCHVISERIMSAVKRADIFYYFTTEYRIQENALKILHEEFTKIIANRREIVEKQTSSEKLNDDSNEFKRPKMAFLDNLLTAHIDGKPLTFQQIFEEVSTFLFEGHDTTASALGFITYCLSRHSNVQQKAFKEQYDMFGSNKKRQPTYQDLNDMKYLEMIIKESLRIFPSVPCIGRTVTTLTKLDETEIPPGTTIMLMIIGNGVDPNYFKEPFKFQPERFSSDKQEYTNPFAYVPFSAGPRNCIGQKFAMMELKATMSKILRNFIILPAVDGLSSGIYEPEFISKCPYDVKLEFSITLKSINGIRIRLQPRVCEFEMM